MLSGTFCQQIDRVGQNGENAFQALLYCFRAAWQVDNQCMPSCSRDTSRKHSKRSLLEAEGAHGFSNTRSFTFNNRLCRFWRHITWRQPGATRRELLLERHPEFRGKFSFAQLAAPSRTKIERYQDLNDLVEKVAARINERFGSAGYQPIILLRSHHEPAEVYRFYRAAHVCYVSSLHDGMNLVAKEFVAARTDLKGVLVLSEFTGAARELTEALIVNPYDLEASSEALAVALTMPVEEQQDRMRSMRSLLAQFNVYRWAGKMLVDAARLRNQDRVTGRLATRPVTGASL